MSSNALPYDKISALVKTQLPEVYQEEAPNYVAFLKAYYEFMEESGRPVYESRQLPRYRDVDETVDEFVEFFRKELLHSLPKNVLGDKRLLAKHAADLHRSRGSQNSYRLLFRMLYGEEIDFFYPGDLILRADGGIWEKPTTIRLGPPISGPLSIDLFGGLETIGQTSGARGRVEAVRRELQGGVLVYSLDLSGVFGTFLDGETVTCTCQVNAVSGSGTIYFNTGPLSAVEITDGGSGHSLGDRAALVGITGTGANASVSEVSNSSAVAFEIVSGGSGYRVESTTETISGGSGTGAAFRVTAISNTQIFQYSRDTPEPLLNVPLNTGPTFVSTGANTSAVSANLAAANVSSNLVNSFAFSNFTVGTISEITRDNPGYGYSSLPTATVEDKEVSSYGVSDGAGGIQGRNAVIGVYNDTGAIVRLAVNQQGAGYLSGESLTVQNAVRSGTVNAAGQAIVTGVDEQTGRYTDTTGWLDWNNVLQDDYYYQEYSYVLRTDQTLQKYASVVKRMLHPAGTKLFGEVLFHSTANAQITLSSYYSNNIANSVGGVKGTGKIDVGMAIVNTYLTTTIFPLANVTIDLLTTASVEGNGTYFLSEVANSDSIYIVDTTSVNSDELHAVNFVDSNTFLLMDTAYSQGTVAGAHYFIL